MKEKTEIIVQSMGNLCEFLYDTEYDLYGGYCKYRLILGMIDCLFMCMTQLLYSFGIIFYASHYDILPCN